MKSKFAIGKKLSNFLPYADVMTKYNLKNKIDSFLSSEYDYLNKNQTLKPSNTGTFWNCGSKQTNDMIMDYVRTLYDQYNITDPTQPSKQIKDQQHKSIIQTPTKRPTFHPRTQTPTNKKGLQTTTKLQTQLHPSFTSIQTQKKQRRAVSIGVKNLQQSSIKRQSYNSTTKFSRKISELTVKPAQPIEASYRYCIGCEEAILIGNMKNHEIVCQEYARIYDMELEAILKYIQTKIDNIRQRTKVSSMRLAEEDTRKMRVLTENICQQSIGINRNGKMNHKFMKDYSKAMDISRKWALTAEDINKLRWFLRIREQIKDKFDY